MTSRFAAHNQSIPGGNGGGRVRKPAAGQMFYDAGPNQTRHRVHARRLGIVRALATWLALGLAMLVFFWSAASRAQTDDFFAGGWSLNPDMSNLTFQSVKKQTVVESSRFATLSGRIDETGTATVNVLLDSVDTKVDLRNVRMRFLFFETFNFPQATITARIDPEQLSDLATLRRKQIPVSYSIDLHGVTRDYEATVTASLLSNELVSVASTTPIAVAVADFNLSDGLKKLEEAASVEIVPTATITFDWVFQRAAPDTTGNRTAIPADEEPAPDAASAALETEGNFDNAACQGRFEILSRAGNIYFKSGSARLEASSSALLDSLASIMLRCPGMIVEVGGHTDSVGGFEANRVLSEARAGSVVRYLRAKGVAAATMVAKGYGETVPIADNSTEKGRWDNRRIEFKVLGG